MFTEDLAEFLRTEDFAVSATYTQTGQQARTINGLFDNSYLETSYEPGTQSAQPFFTCRSADVSAAVHGEPLVISGANYKIRGIEPDGFGLTRLKLEKQ